MPFWKCYYHVVWATHQRQSLISPPLEFVLFESVRQKSGSCKCPILGINATADHIHVAVSIAPNIAVSEWVKLVKGVSSHDANESLSAHATRFQWQRGFGVLTFGEKNLPYVLSYIELQKEHHHAQTTVARLERIDDTD